MKAVSINILRASTGLVEALKAAGIKATLMSEPLALVSFMIAFIPLSLPVSWVIDTYGFRVAVGIGALPASHACAVAKHARASGTTISDYLLFGRGTTGSSRTWHPRRT